MASENPLSKGLKQELRRQIEAARSRQCELQVPGSVVLALLAREEELVGLLEVVLERGSMGRGLTPVQLQHVRRVLGHGPEACMACGGDGHIGPEGETCGACEGRRAAIEEPE